MAREIDKRHVPWTNCLALGSDNANVMSGKQKGVFGLLLKKHPSLYFAGCPCHLIHIAAEKGASCLPFSINDVLIDTYYYLDKSSKRLALLKTWQDEFEVEHDRILKHGSTRWLSAGRCVNRILENWESLKYFFKEEYEKEESTKKKPANTAESQGEPSTPKSRCERMYAFYRSPTNKLYCHFLASFIEIFDKVNTKLQTESPLIHTLRRTLHKLQRDLLLRLKQPAALVGKSSPLQCMGDFKL